MNPPVSKKRILFAWLTDYYLFSYGKDLISELKKRGFEVDVLLHDTRVGRRLALDRSGVKVIYLPGFVRWLSNRSHSLCLRFIFWSAARLYVKYLRKHFDFAIIPWDYRVIWYAISQKIPSLTIHNTTNFIDNDLLIDYVALPDKKNITFFQKLMITLESIIRVEFLPRANRRLLKFDKTWLIDRLMGFKSPNSLHGFSGISYLTVMGTRVKQNYADLGVGEGKNRTTVNVVGSPSYERIHDLKLSMAEKSALLASISVPDNQVLFTFFLSPSHFEPEAVAEIKEVAETIFLEERRAFLLFKFHPKTGASEPLKLLNALSPWVDRIKTITEYRGEEWNAKMILASDYLVQKQGTVGFIAMMHRIPILSYDFIQTDYFDNMYQRLGGSLHAEDSFSFRQNLRNLKTASGKASLRQKQEIACEEFCRSNCSPCEEISKIIEQHFLKSESY